MQLPNVLKLQSSFSLARSSHHKVAISGYSTITAAPCNWHNRQSSTQCYSIRQDSARAPYGIIQHSSELQQQPEDDSLPAILLAGAAAAAGRLPDVLMATFPSHFPTMTSARKGNSKQQQIL
jgi:hypothetical protein